MDGKLRVEDYMVRENVIEIPGGYTVAQTRPKLISTEFHGLPVTEKGHIIGFITAKELLRNANARTE